MRKSSKVLAIIFLITAGGLVFWSTRRDATEIEAAVAAQVTEATMERQREIEEELGERRRALEEEFAARERMREDSMLVREQRLTARLAELDSARVNMEQPVYVRLTADQVGQRLRRMGLAAERGEDDDGDPKFDFKLGTYNVVLYFYGCEGEEGCTSLRIYAGFNSSPSQETILEWARTKRYATAYLNNEGKARLDSDLIIHGGITMGSVDAFILNFRDRLGEFADHIDF